MDGAPRSARNKRPRDTAGAHKHMLAVPPVAPEDDEPAAADLDRGPCAVGWRLRVWP